MGKKIVEKRAHAPHLHLDLSYDDVASLCHQMNTWNGLADRNAALGKPAFKEICLSTKPLWEALISYLDKYS